jgi:leucyl/phenylalanyl-tRNA--protein transferase
MFSAVAEGMRPSAEMCDKRILAQLHPVGVLSAYAQGIFPMVEGGRLYWFSPDPRGLMPLDDRFHVSRRLRRTIRSGRFECTINRRFDEVVGLCARRPGESDAEQGGTWISPEIRLAYGTLHEMGFAHSVEAWPAGAVEVGLPVGGVYGVALGGAFFAESMFHTVTDAGKVALVCLVERLRRRGFVLMDVQWTTENLCRWGAYDLPRGDYLRQLRQAVPLPRKFA